VSFDTVENSSAQVAEAEAWAEGHYRRLLKDGDVEGAKHFAPRPGALRNENPADFYFRSIAEVQHRSFPENWEESSGGECWNELEPALISVRAQAADIFRQLPLHDQAELAVNSRNDWYDHAVRLAQHAV
jgi:hypothetical protein